MEGLGCGGRGGGSPVQSDSCPHSDGTRRKKERLSLVPLASGPPSLLQRGYQSNTPTPTPPPPPQSSPPLSSSSCPAAVCSARQNNVRQGPGLEAQTTLDQAAFTCDPHSSTTTTTTTLRQNRGAADKDGRPKLHLNWAKQGSRKRTRDRPETLIGCWEQRHHHHRCHCSCLERLS